MKTFEVFNGGRITKNLLKDFKKYNDKLTDLMVAIIGNDIKNFADLINTVDLEETDRFGNTALLLASSNGRLVMLRKLIKREANIHNKNNKGEDFYDLAKTRYKFINKVKEYIEKELPEFVAAKKYNL